MIPDVYDLQEPDHVCMPGAICLTQLLHNISKWQIQHLDDLDRDLSGVWKGGKSQPPRKKTRLFFFFCLCLCAVDIAPAPAGGCVGPLSLDMGDW